MIRALSGLAGGLERCGHGLTSRPLEASDAGFLDDLLFLFGYPIGSGQSLVDGSLRMRYCSARSLPGGCLSLVVLRP